MGAAGLSSEKAAGLDPGGLWHFVRELARKSPAQAKAANNEGYTYRCATPDLLSLTSSRRCARLNARGGSVPILRRTSGLEGWDNFPPYGHLSSALIFANASPRMNISW
jgi:hypothetical protein